MIERLNIVKKSVLLNLVKDSMKFQLNVSKLNFLSLKFIWNSQRSKISKTVLEKKKRRKKQKNKGEELILFHLNTYYRATVIKATWQ